MKQYVATAILLIIVPAIAWAADITTTGELIVDPPTLMAIGIAWPIEGDDNRNARVSISYRKKGEVEWSQGLDPLRLQNEQTYTRGSLDYTAPNMFAGSLFDLEEDTDYEVRLLLEDPDGVQGGSGKTVAIRTRADPQPASNGRIFHVYPP